MDQEQITEIVDTLSTYMGILVVAYRGRQEIARNKSADFPCEYKKPFEDEVFGVKKPVGYLFVSEVVYLCTLKIEEYLIVMGPTSETELSEEQAREIAKKDVCNQADVNVFAKRLMENPCIPLNILINFSCMVYRKITGIKLNPSEMLRDGEIVKRTYLEQLSEVIKSSLLVEDHYLLKETAHRFEKRLIDAVKTGDQDMVKSVFQQCPILTVPQGLNQIQHQRNMLIMLTTLVSRAAADCGCSVSEMYSLADYYILRSEKIDNISLLIDLQLQMLLAFTQSVKDLQIPKDASKFVVSVLNYIQNHILEKITVEDMAKEFGLGRNTISKRFKNETGQLLSEYIIIQKLERAKWVLSTTTYSSAEISAYLSFCSQSHFQHMFKKYYSMTPDEYRKKCEEKDVKTI